MDLDKLEQKRQQLESSVEKLRARLKHWQTWEAEYEFLKEEVSSSTDKSSDEDLFKIATSYEGDLIDATGRA